MYVDNESVQKKNKEKVDDKRNLDKVMSIENQRLKKVTIKT